MSIHLNADVSSTWQGAQVFYDEINDKNEMLAKILQEQLCHDLNTKREHKNIQGQYLYSRVNIPGVLIEVGFISNPNERYLLRQSEYQQKVSQAITKGIIKYFSQ